MLPNAKVVDDSRSKMVMCYVTCPWFHSVAVLLPSQGFGLERLSSDWFFSQWPFHALFICDNTDRFDLRSKTPSETLNVSRLLFFIWESPPPLEGSSFVIRKVRVRTEVETKNDGEVAKERRQREKPPAFSLKRLNAWINLKDCWKTWKYVRFSDFRKQQTAFLIGRQNVDLSANVRFPMYINFKGVPTAVMRLTWFVFAKRKTSREVMRELCWKWDTSGLARAFSGGSLHWL